MADIRAVRRSTDATDAFLLLALASMIVGGLLLMAWSLWLLAAD